MGKGKPFNKFWIGWLIRSLRKNRIQGNPLLHSRKKKKKLGVLKKYMHLKLYKY